MALFGHAMVACGRPLLRAERKCRSSLATSGFDPKRTSTTLRLTANPASQSVMFEPFHAGSYLGGANATARFRHASRSGCAVPAKGTRPAG
jgi:hypothetical protein